MLIVLKAFKEGGNQNSCTTWQWLYWIKLFNSPSGR